MFLSSEIEMITPLNSAATINNNDQHSSRIRKRKKKNKIQYIKEKMNIILLKKVVSKMNDILIYYKYLSSEDKREILYIRDLVHSIDPKNISVRHLSNLFEAMIGIEERF